jgi:YbbR domain-containing protein
MIQKVLSKDITPKIVAVILALIVWVQVFNDKNPLERRNFTIDIVPKMVQDGTMIVSTNPQKVNVTFEGRARTLDEMSKDNLKAEADLSQIEAGSFTAEITVDPPYGVRVVEINPKTAVFEVDVMASASVGVAVEINGVPDEDFEKGTPVPSVGTVSITGPGRLVDRVKYVEGAVDISGATDAVTSTTKLSARDSAGNEIEGLKIEPEEIEVTVPLKSLPPSKTVPVQAVVTGTPKPGYKVGPITINPAQVKVRADQRTLDTMTWIATQAIDVSGKDSLFLNQASLQLPRGVTAQDDQVLVQVNIIEDIKTQTYDGIIVQLESPPVGYTWEIDPSTVSVVLTGRSDILSKIRRGDITVYIDAQGRTEGTTDLVVAYKSRLLMASRLTVFRLM